MAVWRTLACVGIVLAVVGGASAQTYPLAEAVQTGDCLRVRLDMTLAGEIRVSREGRTTPIKLSASAAHQFAERVLHVGPNGLADKSARIYEQAKAAIVAGSDRSERMLRANRQLVAAQRHNDVPLAYSPAGPLTREEQELTSEHFDTLCLTGLLPGKAVGAGETWKVPNPVAQALCHFEGLTGHDLTCKLEEVKDNVAHVSVRGTASGIDLGALVKLTVTASYRFDLSAKRLVALEWEQKDEREQGPASPASSVQTTNKLTRSAVATPEPLQDVKLVTIPDGFEVPPQLTNLSYHDPKNRYDLVHGREWQTTGQTDDQLVLRLLERGDFVAQVTLTWWKPAAKGQHLSPEEFRDAMNETPGWEPAMEIQAGEVPSDKDRWVYRLAATGKLDGLEVLQTFYLVAGPDGQQVVLAFTMTPKQAERLGTRDLSLAGSIEFPPK